jgi:leucyl aminopeptidase (aminopeptidase T)
MYRYELQKSADELIKVILGVKSGETVVITADTNSNSRVIDAVASSAYAAGAIPMVITTATPRGVGKAADPDIPVDALTGALMAADVWIEMNKQWLLYSTPFERVTNSNKKLRYICLVEFNEDLMIRNIGQVDTASLRGFMKRVAEMTRMARVMHVENPAGTSVTFDIEPSHYVQCDCGEANEPGIHMLTGQINVVPRFGSVNGTIVFDGCVTPPFGRIVTEPIRLTVEKSVIVKIEGGADAAEFARFLKSFNDDGMFKMAHIAYGFNPGSKLTGNIVEDERVWGCTEWGIGYVSAFDAPPNGQAAVSHTDGICLDSSVWLDNLQILSNGSICCDELKKLYPNR